MMFHTHLGEIAMNAQKLDEAEAEFEHALAIARAAFGTDSLPTADALMNVSAINVLQRSSSANRHSRSPTARAANASQGSC
jgi:hypothetical protein